MYILSARRDLVMVHIEALGTSPKIMRHGVCIRNTEKNYSQICQMSVLEFKPLSVPKNATLNCHHKTLCMHV